MARRDPSERQAYRVFRTLTTRWADNDIYGHMNNVVHYSLFDSAINSWLIAEAGLDIRHGEQIGLVVETGCQYFAEMAFPDTITAGIRVGHLGTSSVRYEIALFPNDAPRAAAEGHFVHVYVDARSRRPAPINETLKSALADLLAA